MRQRKTETETEKKKEREEEKEKESEREKDGDRDRDRDREKIGKNWKIIAQTFKRNQYRFFSLKFRIRSKISYLKPNPAPSISVIFWSLMYLNWSQVQDSHISQNRIRQDPDPTISFFGPPKQKSPLFFISCSEFEDFQSLNFV